VPYSKEELADIADKYGFWQEREDKLTTSLVTHEYRTADSSTMVKQGLVRRLRSLTHAMDRVFQHVAPDEAEPSREALWDTALYLQAFLVNVYGALDNLARVWILEADVKERDKPVPRGHVGLGPGFETVRKSLPASTQEYLTKSDKWFEYLENYRHALAHRIPLYIPPRRLDGEAEKAWREIEDQMIIASAEHKHELWDELLAAQKKIGVFEPWMMHSFGPDPDDGTPVMFHSQIICDLATLIEIAEHILGDIKALPKAAV
jgi:hypothetical protein